MLSSNIEVPNQAGSALGLASPPTISGGRLLNNSVYTDAGQAASSDPVTLTAPTSTVLASANLGGSLTVSWTLPTTYAIAEVKPVPSGQETTNGSGAQCTFDQGGTPN